MKNQELIDAFKYNEECVKARLADVNDELKSTAYILYGLHRDPSEIMLLQIITNLEKILADDLFKDYDDGEYLVLTKILLNYQEAQKKVKLTGTWLYGNDMFDIPFTMLKDLMIRGQKDDLKRMTKDFFIYSLREMLIKVQLPSEIDYSYIDKNFISQWLRRRRLIKEKGKSK